MISLNGSYVDRWPMEGGSPLLGADWVEAGLGGPSGAHLGPVAAFGRRGVWGLVPHRLASKVGAHPSPLYRGAPLAF